MPFENNGNDKYDKWHTLQKIPKGYLPRIELCDL